MNNLLNFIVKHIPWFIFIIYLIISLVLLFNNNPYQQSVYLSSANGISSTVYKGYSGITSYFGLKDINEELQQRNAALEMEVVKLQKELQNLKQTVPDTTGMMTMVDQFDYVVAHVISNSISQPANYITIDRGSDDGIQPEMGVVDHNGVVGVVNVVGRHSARIISILNPNMKLSCKVRRMGNFGTLTWDSKDPNFAVLEGLPREGKYVKGDTIVTSGYSTMFPEGIMVGTVEGTLSKLSGSFVALKVRLSTNFSQLSTIRAIRNKMKVELKALETKDNDLNNEPGQKKKKSTNKESDKKEDKK